MNSFCVSFNWSESFFKSWPSPKCLYQETSPPPLIGNVFNWVSFEKFRFFSLVSPIHSPHPPHPHTGLFFPSNPGVFCTSGFICPGAHPWLKDVRDGNPQQSIGRSTFKPRFLVMQVSWNCLKSYPDTGPNWLNWPHKKRRQSKKPRLNWCDFSWKPGWKLCIH